MDSKQITLALLGAGTIAGGITAALYLSQEKTIKDRLISSGKSLINSQEEYEVAFMENRNQEELINTITTNSKVINNKSLAKEGGEALSEWCEINLNLELSEKNKKEILPKTEKYCTKPSRTIEERANKAGKKLLSNWTDKLAKLKSPSPTDNSLTKDLEVTSLENSGTNKVEEKLQNWCNSNIKKPLIEDKEDAVWNKVDLRCLEPK